MSRTVTLAARRTPARSAREAAITVLSRVEAGEAFANVLLHHALAQAHLSPADAGLATELVLGSLRHQTRIDWTLQDALSHPIDDLPPSIRAILRTGIYQLLFLQRIPPHAAVHEAVDLARRYGHAGTAKLANAVLRRVATNGERSLPDATRDPVSRLAIEHSHPHWLVSRWVARLGQEAAAALCRTNNEPAPVTARINLLKASPAEVVQQMAAAGVVAEPTALPEGLLLRGSFGDRHRLVDDGWLMVQDVGAMLVTHALDPQPGETIIDACAAPGGKATHIAERMRNRGRVIACDIHPAKLRAMSHRAAAMGVEIIEAHHQDAKYLGKMFAGLADRLLVDAPCTGVGVVRRRPDIKWRLEPEDLHAMATLQLAILEGACAAVRPGGRLLYSVCSTEPEEGRAVVNQFLSRHREFLRDQEFPLPDAITRDRSDALGEATLLPHLHGTDGFYIARMYRRGVSTS